MSASSIFGKGVLSALAVALVTTAIPATAFAQDERRAERGGRSWGGGEARREGGVRPDMQRRDMPRGDMQRGDVQRGGAEFRNRGTAQIQTPQPQVQTAPQQRQSWNGTARPERSAQEQRSTARQPGWDGTRWNPTNPSQARAVEGRNWERDRDRDRDTSRDRNWSSSNRGQNPAWNGRNSTYSDRDRNTNYRRDDNRNGWSNRDSWNNRSGWNGRDNDRRWSNNWRQDRRYDWSGYRNSNRNLYRMPRYFAPYRGYNYSRLSIGFVLGSGFYGSNYWINDPWSYRLPPAYAGYRWIRYYDDVILVDTYTGEVADVIHNFFW